MTDPTQSTQKPAAQGLGWALQGIASNRCPRCAKTRIFGKVFVMQPKCSACGYVYERENGYFLGAMVLAYFMGAFSTVPTLVIGIMIAHSPMFAVTALACAQVILLTPFLFRFSRLAWIYLDYRADPKGR